MMHSVLQTRVIARPGYARETADRDILGFDLGALDESASWLEFLNASVQRGLRGWQLLWCTEIWIYYSIRPRTCTEITPLIEMLS